MEPLEQMVEMTAKLFECDRDEMYSYILRLCSTSPPLVPYTVLLLCLLSRPHTHTHISANWRERV